MVELNLTPATDNSVVFLPPVSSTKAQLSIKADMSADQLDSEEDVVKDVLQPFPSASSPDEVPSSTNPIPPLESVSSPELASPHEPTLAFSTPEMTKGDGYVNKINPSLETEGLDNSQDTL